MKKSSLLQRIIIGLQQNPLEGLLNTFFVYATIWAVLEPLFGIVSGAEKYLSGKEKFLTLMTISILVGLLKTAVPNDICISYNGSIIRIGFGDLFASDGIKVIPVSSFFEEVEVVPTSLQGQIIQFCLRHEEGIRGIDTYIKEIQSALQDQPYRNIYRNATEREEKYYQTGTTAFIKLNGEQYLLFALTETELKGHIPPNNCNPLRLWLSLDSFWQYARTHSRGGTINLPLIGSGVSGIKLTPRRLLEMNLMAIATALEDGKVTTEEIRIVLHPKYIKYINLQEFHRLWRKK